MTARRRCSKVLLLSGISLSRVERTTTEEYHCCTFIKTFNTNTNTSDGTYLHIRYVTRLPNATIITNANVPYKMNASDQPSPPFHCYRFEQHEDKAFHCNKLIMKFSRDEFFVILTFDENIANTLTVTVAMTFGCIANKTTLWYVRRWTLTSTWPMDFFTRHRRIFTAIG